MNEMSMRELVTMNRSYRRFDAETRVPATTLRNLVTLARLAPSGGNKQSLRFRLINRPIANSIVFPCLAWAGYLEDWSGPAENERPTAYVVILHDVRVGKSSGNDAGIAAQTMMLGAVEAGFGGCIIGSIARAKLRKKLDLPEHLHIELVLALGKPAETVRIARVKNNDIRYWRDCKSVHNVPKRMVHDLIV